MTCPGKTEAQEAVNFGLRGSIRAGFTGRFAVDVTQVRVSNKRLEDLPVLRENLTAAVEGKWETRSVFQGGSIAVFFSAAYVGELVRRPIGQCRVRTVVVVVLAPQGQLVTSISQGEEDFHVQALIAQLAVEALDIAVLDRLARPDEIQVHSVLVGHRSIAFEANSVPLSTVIDCRVPRSATTLSSAVATFSPLNAVLANRVRHSRVN
jgi:hypothetical protein